MIIVIGTIDGIVNCASVREFSNKEKTRTFKYCEISFHAPSLHINGTLKDWDLTVPVDMLKPGVKIKVNYQACCPKKDCFGVFEFNGFPVLQ